MFEMFTSVGRYTFIISNFCYLHMLEKNFTYDLINLHTFSKHFLVGTLKLLDMTLGGISHTNSSC